MSRHLAILIPLLGLLLAPAAFAHRGPDLRDESLASSVKTTVSFSGGTSVQEYEGNALLPTVENIRGSDYGGGVGGLLYTIRNNQPSYTYENKRGDVIAKTDATGVLTYQASYEAFGTRTQEQGYTLDRQKANTKDEDPTGLLLEGQRYRLLKFGVFLNADPLGHVDGPNVYTYVRQNPWTSFDPEGLETIDDYQKQINKIESQRQKELHHLDKTHAGSEEEKQVIRDEINKKYDQEVSLPQGSIAHIRRIAQANNEAVAKDIKDYRETFNYKKAAAAAEGFVDENTLDDKSSQFKDASDNVNKHEIAEVITNVMGGGAMFKSLRGSSGGARGAAVKPSKGTIHVAPNGAAFPSGKKYTIPSHYIENPKRPGSYGVMVNGKFVEKLRIDPPTPHGKKGPDYSHYHLDGGKEHYVPQPDGSDPGFNP